MLFRSTPTKKARRAGRRLTKRANKRGNRAMKEAAQVTAATQERAAEWAEKAGTTSHDLADQVAERLRSTDALARAQAAGAGLATKARDTWHDSHLDDRVSEFAERVRSSEAARRAAGRTTAVTDASLSAVGDWLGKSKSGKEVSKRLGVRRRRRWPVLVAALGGLAGGFAVARATNAQPAEPLAEDLAGGVDRLASPAGAAGTVVADSVRAALASDPRTVSLHDVQINVAEGTVFVRGNVPPEVDQAAVREVVASVPGVEDVDLQLAPTA